jgi:hypothetical protein
MIQLDRVGVARWELASAALQEYQLLLDDYMGRRTYGWEYTRTRLNSENLVGERAPNWLFDGMQQHGLSGWDMFALGIASAVYGGLHAAAWHKFFPTFVERIL